MAVLHLPLTLNSAGVFDRAETEENIVGSRLKMFILSGAGEFLRLPSPGIRALWVQLCSMGVSSRLRDILQEQERLALEQTIKDEVTVWFAETGEALDVQLLGDESNDNGILFETKGRQFIFRFQYALPGHGLTNEAVGPWNILESSNVIS
jgi:hypothetical protein